MRLTVGPLPPAVYWRRRAIVVGALVLVVALLVSMCNGSGGSGGQRNAAANAASPTLATDTGASVLPPIVGDGGDGGGENLTVTGSASPEPTAVAPAGGGPPPSASGPCADTDMSLMGMVTPLAKGYYLSMKVKNTSSHACTRDVGGGPQVLQVVNASGTAVWTSDLCAAAGSSPQPDVRTFGPGIEIQLPPHPFYWDGTIGRCRGGSALPAGAYRLVAQLGTKVSDPVALIGK